MLTLTVYYPGDTPEDALEGMPFDAFESADEFRSDNGLAHVFSVSAVIDPNTIAVVTR